MKASAIRTEFARASIAVGRLRAKLRIHMARLRVLEALDQPGVDQQAVEAARFLAAGAGKEQATAALQHPLLLGEGRVERQPRDLLHDQRQIWRLNGVECGGEVDRLEVDRVDGVI